MGTRHAALGFRPCSIRTIRGVLGTHPRRHSCTPFGPRRADYACAPTPLSRRTDLLTPETGCAGEREPPSDIRLGSRHHSASGLLLSTTRSTQSRPPHPLSTDLVR